MVPDQNVLFDFQMTALRYLNFIFLFSFFAPMISREELRKACLGSYPQLFCDTVWPTGLSQVQGEFTWQGTVWKLEVWESPRCWHACITSLWTNQRLSSLSLFSRFDSHHHSLLTLHCFIHCSYICIFLSSTAQLCSSSSLPSLSYLNLSLSLSLSLSPTLSPLLREAAVRKKCLFAARDLC